MLDATKAYLLNSNYYKIEATTSFVKTVGLISGVNEIFSLASSVDFVNALYHGKMSQENLGTIAFKGTIAAASVALFFSPYSLPLKIGFVSLSFINFSYKGYNLISEINAPIKFINCIDEFHEKCFIIQPKFLQFKNLGETSAKSQYLSTFYTDQVELSKNSLFVEYIVENCKYVYNHFACTNNGYDFDVYVSGDSVFS